MVSNILFNTETKMQTTVDVLKRELAIIRTGRATPALVDQIRVDYAGVPTPLNQMATISAPEARLLVIQPWDRSTIQNIEKAILKSDLGLNPATDGAIVRLAIPPLTEERRRELTRVVRRKVEEKKVIIRNLRHEAIDELKKLEKNKEISQDEHKRTLEQLQKLTDGLVAKAEQVGQAKETELMEV
ncbi:MAG: ribosome recycling factor [Dehalococcoidales bacterium]|nr:ribosome recycling factor [Dehalococcoidales bacterium]